MRVLAEVVGQDPSCGELALIHLALGVLDRAIEPHPHLCPECEPPHHDRRSGAFLERVGARLPEIAP